MIASYPRRPWHNLWLVLIALALLVLATSCARLATDRGIRREAGQRGMLTIVHRDTIIYRERVVADTVVRLDTLRSTDTIRLTRDRLRVQVVRDHDTLRITGECRADTIRVPVVRTIVQPGPVGFWPEYGPGIALVLAVLLAFALLFRWGSSGGKPD